MVYPEGSFGNGGAMRAPADGLFFSPDAEDEVEAGARSLAKAAVRRQQKTTSGFAGAP